MGSRDGGVIDSVNNIGSSGFGVGEFWVVLVVVLVVVESV